ncbi:MAG: hypothetical protein RLP14_06385 [Owenweeksia sp.]
MTNYNFKIKNLSFSISGSDKTLKVDLTGNSFPEPSDTDGSIQNGDVVFDLSPGNGGSVSETEFSYSGNGFTSGIFRFDNIPVGSSTGSLNGETRNYDTGGLFELEECNLTADDTDTNKKGLGTKIRRKPNVSQNYEVNSFTLATVDIDGMMQLAAVMSVSQSSTNDLQATCDKLIDFSELNDPLPIVVKNESDSDSLELVGRIYIHD